MFTPKFSQQQYAEIDSPDAIDDQTTAGVGDIYYGYCKKGSTAATATWSIRKATVTATTVIYTWAGNKHKYDQVWDARLSLLYGFIK